MATTLIKKRSIKIYGHATSISLEDGFWQGIKDIAQERNITVTQLVEQIANMRKVGGLSSAVRTFVLNHVKDKQAQLDALKSGIGSNIERSGSQ